MRFFNELKRRKVFRATVAYLIVSWIAIQVADIMLFNFSAPGWVFKTMVTLLVIGFPLTLILAWAFDFSSDGIKRETEADSVSPIRRKVRKLIAITLVFSSIVTVFLVWNKLGYDESSPAPTANDNQALTPTLEAPVLSFDPDEPSVAVLPFVNRSASDENAYFTDGIHDDLLSYLSDNESLRVISRTSVLRYRDTEKPIPEIARELGVDAILEGGVQRAGDQVHINVQLIDGTTDEHLWAEVYDRKLTTDNVFKLQAEIAQAIASALNGELTDVATAGVRPPTVSMEAYDKYLRAHDLLNGPAGDLESYRNVQSLLNEVIALDPEYLQAWLALSLAHEFSFWFGDSNLDYHRQQARWAIEQAASIGPDDPRILAARGLYEYHIEKDYQTALDFISLALNETPKNSRLLFSSGLAHRRLGHWDDALKDFRKSLKSDPANMLTQVVYVHTLLFNNQYSEGMAYLRDLIEKFPEETELRLTLADFELKFAGKIEPALKLLSENGHSNTVQYRSTIIRALWYKGDFEGAVSFLQDQELKASTKPELIRQANLLQTNYYMSNQEPDVNKARQTLDEIEAWALENEDTSESVRGIMAISAALAGDLELLSEIRAETLEDIEDESDVISNNGTLEALAVALAISGDKLNAWNEIEALIDQPSGVSKWDLKLHPGYSTWFADIPSYHSFIQ